jgi:hypothetical protein
MQNPEQNMSPALQMAPIMITPVQTHSVEAYAGNSVPMNLESVREEKLRLSAEKSAKKMRDAIETKLKK